MTDIALVRMLEERDAEVARLRAALQEITAKPYRAWSIAVRALKDTTP